MTEREQAQSMAKDLALTGKSAEQISGVLEKRGLSGILDQAELEFILSEARFAKSLLPARPSRIIPRLFGIVAIMLGIAGIWIGRDGPSARGYSPVGFGLAAVVLGVLLIVRPYSAYDKF